MPFVKKRTGDKFTLIPNGILEHKDLDLRDIGLLCFLLHLPEDWDFSVEGLVKVLKNNGRASIMSGLKSLEEAGFLIRFQSRRYSGSFSDAVWVVSDTPLTKKDIVELAQRYSDFPSSGKPSSENPSSENRTQINTKEIYTLDINSNKCIYKNKSNNSTISKTKEKNTKSDFENFWASYPKKVGKEAARKAFGKVRGVSLETMLSALERQKRSEQWTKNGGQFIPNPSTWLNQGRWDDELSAYNPGASSGQKKKNNGNPFMDMARGRGEIVSEQDADCTTSGDAPGSLSYALPERGGAGS